MSERDKSQWFTDECPTCGRPVEWRWTGLDLVEHAGDETLASKEYRHVPQKKRVDWRGLARMIVRAVK